MNKSYLLSNVHGAVTLPSGCKEAALVIGKYDYYHYGVDGVDDKISCKILHVSSGSEVLSKATEILHHFVKYGSPVMIGGDNDASSKTLIGICQTENEEYFFLIAVGPPLCWLC
ncbi:hypothetical protein QZH41_009422 [Actinostola sp. cb2023]|nr:hypothetical protein QZH41_009422 [Actinostola sp. cb2023]